MDCAAPREKNPDSRAAAFATYFTALLNPERRGLHDLICGTRIVVK